MHVGVICAVLSLWTLLRNKVDKVFQVVFVSQMRALFAIWTESRMNLFAFWVTALLKRRGRANRQERMLVMN